MTEISDPWKDLKPPAEATTVSGRRVDPELEWNLYWAVGSDRSCLLILQHTPGNRPRNKLPNLRGLEIELRASQDGDHALLVIRLKDNEQRDIFHRLCLDVVTATRLAESEEEAIERFLARTWRWHRLLRAGPDKRLSDEEQKGLIGELQLLKRHLFPSIGIEASVRSWTGPLDAPKDFEVGRVCIEVKARRGASTPYVTVSTEHQLDTTGIDALFLSVVEVTATPEDDPNGLTITDVARSVLEEVRRQDVSVVDLMEERLLAVGFDWDDDYSDRKWLIGAEHLYDVTEGFPRVTPDMYPAGVSNVRYAISLQECEAFRTDHARMISQLVRGESGDHT